MRVRKISEFRPTGNLLRRLARDRSGNVIAMIAASLFPLLALLGGGIDMGRGYLAQSRLQQACDAGVLAARKRLGSSVAVDGSIPSDVAETGNRFFNINFADGAYGTENRDFQMTMEANYNISGTASVDVPTTLMAIFGYDMLDVSVDCGSILNFSDLDIMMVIDTTGSMRHTNAGDTLSRIESVKQVVRNFYAQIDSNKAPNTEIRYGFVPYSTNVNVGHLLQDEWMVDSWDYQGRVATGATVPNDEVSYTYQRNWSYVSGTRVEWTLYSSYAATYHAAANADDSGWYSCDRAEPADSWVTSYTWDEAGQYKEVQTDPPAVLNITPGQKLHNGTRYQTVLNGTTCEVQYSRDTNYIQNLEEVEVVPSLDRTVWRYAKISLDVSNWRDEQDSCIEERDTYKIDDYDNVDFSRALDLDIDLVPTPGQASTQWRPRYPEQIYARSLDANGGGSFTVPPVVTTDEFVDSGTWWFSVCPPPAQKLQEMTTNELDAYLLQLSPKGATYHDIGMIWGGRLLSPTGLFAGENADTNVKTRSRHMIWLTDGQTEPYDLAYGAYGTEGLDRRRWAPGDALSLAQTIEARFGVACEQVKNRNITVWVVAFGTTLNPIMEKCGGPGRTFEAANAEELNDAFMEIASSMSELRINN